MDNWHQALADNGLKPDGSLSRGSDVGGSGDGGWGDLAGGVSSFSAASQMGQAMADKALAAQPADQAASSQAPAYQTAGGSAPAGQSSDASSPSGGSPGTAPASASPADAAAGARQRAIAERQARFTLFLAALDEQIAAKEKAIEEARALERQAADELGADQQGTSRVPALERERDNLLAQRQALLAARDAVPTVIEAERVLSNPVTGIGAAHGVGLLLGWAGRVLGGRGATPETGGRSPAGEPSAAPGAQPPGPVASPGQPPPQSAPASPVAPATGTQGVTGVAPVHERPASPFPDRSLPRDAHGRPTPDPEAAGSAHSQLGRQEGRRGSYPQAREFDENNTPARDIDFTDHGRPRQHPNPHQHRYIPNPTGGTPQRGPAEPLE